MNYYKYLKKKVFTLVLNMVFWSIANDSFKCFVNFSIYYVNLLIWLTGCRTRYAVQGYNKVVLDGIVRL